MKLSHIIVLITTALVSGGSGLLAGSLIGKTLWTIGDGVPMGICLTTEIAKEQGAMTQAEIDRIIEQARTKVQTAANRVVPKADFNVSCPEALGSFPR
jgi:hypothetical protein